MSGFIGPLQQLHSAEKLRTQKDAIRDTLGEVPILPMKHTTLFERMAEHGQDWQHNVHHQRDMSRLRKTQKLHERLYRQIIEQAGYEAITDD